MNPLQLKGASRKLYEALVELHHTDVSDERLWLARHRKMKTIMKMEGMHAIDGWRCFYTHYQPRRKQLPLPLAEAIYKRGIKKL